MWTPKIRTGKRLLPVYLLLLVSFLFTACQKNMDREVPATEFDNEQELVGVARELERSAAANAEQEGTGLGFSDESEDQGRRQQQTIVEIAIGNPNFSSLVAAVVKCELVDALANPNASLTVFAPTNAAFAQLPAPFNSAASIGAISDAGQIAFLRNVLLYHVVGTRVLSNQISNGRSSAATLKPAGSSNDNTVYFSKTFNLIRINGRTDVIAANIKAKNGVIHAINKVLLFPTNNIADIAIADPNFSSLVAALVKTNLAGVFAGSGDFTVFAPTNAAFAKLPAPFNSANNISAINDPAQIDALANILKYHVIGSRYFNWDFGILKKIPTLAAGSNNKVTTILGYNIGWVRANSSNYFNPTEPGDILATNGVIHVIGNVLLPR